MLYGENGLLLTPSIDHAFDRRLIGFEGIGNVNISARTFGERIPLPQSKRAERMRLRLFAGGP